MFDRYVPEIIVPIASPEPQKLFESWMADTDLSLTRRHVTAFEIRLDALGREGLHDIINNTARATRLYAWLGRIRRPIIATWRSIKEGGCTAASLPEQMDLYVALAKVPQITYIDIEASFPLAPEAVAVAKVNGKKVIMSQHFFEEQSWQCSQVIDHLDYLDTFNPDVVKLALMPRSASDVAAVFNGCDVFTDSSDTPAIVIAMGQLGQLSRLIGYRYGCAATFATLKDAASAPGQVAVDEVIQTMLEDDSASYSVSQPLPDIYGVESTGGPYEDDLDVARDLADIADEISLTAFNTADFTVETKPNMTLVTTADRSVEQAIRKHLARVRPYDAIYGEEFGTGQDNTDTVGGTDSPDDVHTVIAGIRKATSKRRWIIDPIDGTHSFVRGVPVWATLIALEEDGQIVVGMVSAPALGRRWWAARGSGAVGSTTNTLTGEVQLTTLNVSKVADVDHANLSFSSLSGWKKHGMASGFLHLLDRVWRVRGYGDFWSYMMVAEGVEDIACEPELELYDMAALVPIVEQAGGTFTDLNGTPGPWGPNALATNGLLHSETLRIIHEEE